MQVLIVNQDEVRALLPMNECIDVMADALRTLARGDVILPLRPVMRLPDPANALILMPADLAAPAALGLKVITIFPGNAGSEFDSHPGVVMLFDTEHGQPLAIMDASEITAIRTAAVSGLATRLLAREDAADLALLGSGTQARTHLEAMLAVRPVRRVRVWSRTAERARAFAVAAARRHGLPVESVGAARDAVEGADLICTATASPEPVLLGDWIAPGAHINAVGSSIAATRELDTAALVRARLFVDRRESTLNEAGEFLIPKREGAIDDDHIQAELGELLLGTKTGRTSPDEITLFKSLGIAIEDVAAARHIYVKAQQQHTGTSVELGGARHTETT
jgi:ornithine cyclodeaminase/alanine dehydrogenase-like protein (mu-crystallin family)